MKGQESMVGSYSRHRGARGIPAKSVRVLRESPWSVILIMKASPILNPRKPAIPLPIIAASVSS